MTVRVDAHVHVYEDGRYGGSDQLLREMDEAGINKAIMIAVPGIASNSFVLEVCERYPDRLSALVYPEFGGEGFLLNLSEQLSRKVCSGIKIHPRLQKISPIDAEVYKIMSLAGEAEVPVIFDAFLYGKELDSPSLSLTSIHRIAADFPDVKVVIAHAGGHRLIEAMLIAKSNTNVFLDISFILKYFEGFAFMSDLLPMIRKVGADRVIYGSDYPSYKLKDYAEAANVALHKLTEDEKLKVYGGSAERVYQL